MTTPGPGRTKRELLGAMTFSRDGFVERLPKPDDDKKDSTVALFECGSKHIKDMKAYIDLLERAMARILYTFQQNEEIDDRFSPITNWRILISSPGSMRVSIACPSSRLIHSLFACIKGTGVYVRKATMFL